MAIPDPFCALRLRPIGWAAAVALALALALTGSPMARAAEVGATVCAVFGAGPAARVHCGIVTAATPVLSEVQWTDCTSCAKSALNAHLSPSREAAEPSLSVARKTTLVMSELARGGPLAGFAPWVQAVVDRASDASPGAPPRRCAADVNGDGTSETAEIATGPLPLQDTLLLTQGGAHHVLFRGELAGGYDRANLMVKCLPEGVVLCFQGMDCFSAWTWNGKAYVEVNLWDETNH